MAQDVFGEYKPRRLSGFFVSIRNEDVVMNDDLKWSDVLPIFALGYIPDGYKPKVVVTYNRDGEVSMVMTYKQAFYMAYSLLRTQKYIMDALEYNDLHGAIKYQLKEHLSDIEYKLSTFSDKSVIDASIKSHDAAWEGYVGGFTERQYQVWNTLWEYRVSKGL